MPARHPTDPPAAELTLIAEARHHDPFDLLGRHPEGEGERILAYLPSAEEVTIAEIGAAMSRLPGSDFFLWRGAKGAVPPRYRFVWLDKWGQRRERHDPYGFPPQLGDLDLHLFGEGKHWHAYRFLGAHPHQADGVAGVLFAVWAPNAERVSVVGEFNQWDGRCLPMRVRGASGVWELFVPGLQAGALYKFEIRAHGGAILLKSDPYGQFFEKRPSTASIVTPPAAH